jgi:bacterioferritin-associated ferredoxin
MYVCLCNGITERQVRECARRGASSLEQLGVELGVGMGCGRCRDSAEELLRAEAGGEGRPVANCSFRPEIRPSY